MDYSKLRHALAMCDGRIACESTRQCEDVIQKLEDAGYRLCKDCCNLDSDRYDEMLTVWVHNGEIYLDYDAYFDDMSYGSFINLYKDCLSGINQSAAKNEVPIRNEKKGSNEMNMFGNIEFGISKDTNIASTLLGVAVKGSAGGWRIYDKDKKSITDVGDFKPGEFPVYVVPAKTLKVGDLVKRDGSYLYVTELVKDGGVKGVAVDTGIVEEIVPVQNLLGMSLYTKVVSIMDGVMDDDADMTKLMMLSACAGGKAGDMNQMLPLLLLKGDKKADGEEGGSSDKKLMKMVMLMAGCSGGDQNQILPLLLMDAI